MVPWGRRREDKLVGEKLRETRAALDREVGNRCLTLWAYPAESVLETSTQNLTTREEAYLEP
jgi:hypothetical protein